MKNKKKHLEPLIPAALYATGCPATARTWTMDFPR